MSRAKYHYAYNDSNDIVGIDTVTEDDRKSHKYHCISCGAEMIAKLGSKNIHHFAHKGGDESCSVETYLHKLGKFLLKKKFYEDKEFLIKYNRKSKCSNYNACSFHKNYDCVHIIDSPINLKNYFDSCIEEQIIDNFRADLLLSDSTGKSKAKIMLEIRVSHECTEKKIASGHRIIEVQVKSEDDLLGLLDSPIEENERNKFYGFKRDLKNTTFRYTRRLPRFCLYPNHKAYVDYYADCFPKKRNMSTLLELIMDEDSYIDMDNALITEEELQTAIGVDYYKVGLVYAIEMGIAIKNCSLCKYCRTGIDRPLFCCMSKKYGTPKEPQREYAAECHYYSPEQAIREIKKVIANLSIVAIENTSNDGL